MGFHYLSSPLSVKEEALFSINVNRDLSYELAKEAFLEIFKDKNDQSRELFLVQILNGLMAKKPTVQEVTGLLDAVFEYDNFDYKKRTFFKSNKTTITVAGSGKKGIKTVNLSSLSAFVASCFDVTIVKLCSPSTSSSTGSQDLISILSDCNDWCLKNMESIAQDTGIGFFSVEAVLPKFASIYSGRFYAPHALSYALAGMATNYKTDKMLYGLSHPNISLSVDVFRHYETPQVMVISSTLDGIHYIDESTSLGGTLVEGYKSLDSEPKRQGIMYFGEILGNFKNEKVMASISQEKNQLENITKGLSGLTGSNPVLEKQIAINAAIILYITTGGDIVNLYKKCQDVIRSGAPLEKIRCFVSKISGSRKKVDDLIMKAKCWKP